MDHPRDNEAAAALGAFPRDISVSGYVTSVCQPVLEQHDAEGRATPAARIQPKVELRASNTKTLVDQLLIHFQRAGEALERHQAVANESARAAQEEAATAEEAFQVQVAVLESGLDEAHGLFQTLEVEMRSVARRAGKLGGRLQAAESGHARAVRTAQAIQHLREFALLRHLGDLSDLFHDDNRLSQAAVRPCFCTLSLQLPPGLKAVNGVRGSEWRARREAQAVTRHIQAVATEVLSVRARRDLLEAPHPSAPAPCLGTLEHALVQVETFRAQLEHRCVARFDTGVAAGDLAAMITCARIMAEFPRGQATLVQRYIATRPMFMDAKELAAPAAGGAPIVEAGAAVAALRALSALYKGLLAAVREEALVMEQVFAAPRRALAILVHRMFEQRVQAALDAMLVAPPATSSPAVIQQFLKLLAEAYAKTLKLADSLQEVVGDGGDVAKMAESVFAEALADYPDPELLWLQLLHKTSLSKVQGLSQEAIAQFFQWNREAVERCRQLSPARDLAANARQLFHASTVHRAVPGCLLEQVASHLVGGLDAAVASCARSCSLPFGLAQVGTPPSRIAITKAAYSAVADGAGRVLEAVAAASGIVRGLQQHYARVVAPCLREAHAEAAAASAGLAALVRAVEERVLIALAAALDASFAQAARTLAAEQRAGDTAPPEDGPPPALDRPTDACTLVCALLRSLTRLAAQHLAGSNLASFDAEVGQRAQAMLAQHMRRQQYSALGGLRLKRDISEFAEALRATRSPAADAQMEELAAAVNMLVVAPESLPSLVDGQLRIGHKAALAIIALRSDFKTARVSGQSLAQVFGSD